MGFVNKASQKVSSVFQQFDLFGQDIKFNFNNQTSYRTGFGGFFTIVFVTLLFLLFQQNINSFVNRENISVASENLYSPHPSKIDIDPKEMIFAFKIFQDDFVKRPMFNITLEDRHYIRSEGGEVEKIKKPVPLTQCTRQHFTQLNKVEGLDWGEIYDLYSFDDYLCPPLNYEFSMGGLFASKDFMFQKIKVSLCQNSTDIIEDTDTEYTSACPPQEEIDDFVSKDVNFQLYFPNKLINPDDPKNPVQTFLFDEIFFEIQAGQMYKTANLFFKEDILETDMNLLPLQSVETERNVLFEPGDLREQISLRTNDVPAEFYFRRSPYTIKHIRAYEKLDSIVSYIGGFLESIIIGATFIIGYYNKLHQTVSIANKLYNFEFQGKKKQQKTTAVDEQIKNLKQLQINNNNKNPIDDIYSNNILSNSNGKQNDNTDKLYDQRKKRYSISMCPQKNFNRSSNRDYSLHATDIREIIIERQKALSNLESSSSSEESEPEKKAKSLQEIPSSQNQIQPTFENMPKENASQQKITINKPTVDKYVIMDSNNKKIKKKSQLSRSLTQQYLFEGLGFNSRKEFLIQQFKEIVNKHVQINITLKYFLSKLFCNKLFVDEQIILIDKAKDKVSQDLDIYMLLDSLKEIEKMKHVVFDRDQEVLFNFFPKHIITKDDKYSEISEIKLRNMILNQEKKIKKKKITESKKEEMKALGFREIVIAQKVAKKFKKYHRAQSQILNSPNKSMNLFQKLYTSYEVLIKQRSNDIYGSYNKRLVNLMGEDLREIFETSKLIKFSEKQEKNTGLQNMIANLKKIQTGKQDQQAKSVNQLKYIQQSKLILEENKEERDTQYLQDTSRQISDTSRNLMSQKSPTHMLHQKQSQSLWNTMEAESKKKINDELNYDDYLDDLSNKVPIEYDCNNSGDLVSEKILQDKKNKFINQEFMKNSNINLILSLQNVYDNDIEKQKK